MLKWFHEQDADYRRHVVANAELWERAMAPGAAWTEETLLVAYLRKMSAPACRCGFDGSPRSVHQFGFVCMRRDPVPVTRIEDEDDDLPF